MATIALLAVALLVAAATRMYRIFSYLAALFIVANVGAASVERNDGELDLAPYGRLLVGLLAVFAVGFSLIWLRWSPGATEYTYLLGLPVSTLAYVVFLWLLPILGAFYYALVFPSIGSDDVVDDIMSDVRQAQRGEQYPLSVARTTADGGETSEQSPEHRTAEENDPEPRGERVGSERGERR